MTTMRSKFGSTVRALLKRPADANKYDFGHLLVIGGSVGMVGAPLLTGEAALRTGAGLVTIAAPNAIVPALERGIPELMVFPLPSDGHRAVDELHKFVTKRHVSAIAVGPGLKINAAPLVRELLKMTKLPMVIDAGGIEALHGHLDLLTDSEAPIVITPHTGEFKKLTNVSVPPEMDDRERFAQGFADEYGATLVLKGDHTVVASPQEKKPYVNTNGNPGLATAGTGDVLTGIIAGLIAQGVNLPMASKLGVFLHGLAGDIAERDETQPGMIATDVIGSIPKALKHTSTFD